MGADSSDERRRRGEGDGRVEDGPGPAWSSKKRQVTYEQGKRVLQAQKNDINQIDDKALRTVRITAVIIGVGATGLQATDAVTVDETTGAIGLFLLFLSISFGVLTYSESSEIVGPTAEYLDRMRSGRLGTDWEADLLYQYPGWVSRNQRKVERNALLFNFCQVSLMLGVGFGAASLIELRLLQTVTVLVCGFVVVLALWFVAEWRTEREHPN